MAVGDTGYRHIVLDATGVTYIEGTTIKVVELILDHIAYGWSAEELYLQHPHLSLGQIHSALAYYWDHKEAIDQDIARRQERVAEQQRNVPVAPLVEQLMAKRQVRHE